MKLTFLGTGTSTGVPQIGCRCEVCQSSDPRDNRMRCSALVEDGPLRILIDCGPDFRTQILRENAPHIDALLLTHYHYDHAAGIDDLRPYCSSPDPFPIYCEESVSERLHALMPYSLGPAPYPGAPKLDICVIRPFNQFSIIKNGHSTLIEPIRIMHTDSLKIIGFMIGDLAYVTDCLHMPTRSLQTLIKRKPHTLVINALRHKEHRSHMNLSQALDVIKAISPRNAYLTHISHGLGLHAEVEKLLPENVTAAYDRLSIEIN